MKTNELYEKVRTAAIGDRLTHNGKAGTVCPRHHPATCSKCIYHGADTCDAVNAIDGLPCLVGTRFDGRAVCVLEG
jgi:hypothetical protein